MGSIADPSTWHKYADIDPEFKAILDAVGPNGIPSMSAVEDIPSLRKMVGEMMAQQMATAPPPDYSGVKKSDIQIPVRDGSSIRGVLYQPEAASAPGPLVVLYHGGGFCIGIPEMEEPFALEVVRKFSGVALSVDYRMAPEHPFPVPVDDSYDALKWAAANASSLGADPSKGFIVSGQSAGANLSAVVSHLARDDGMTPALTGVHLNVPAVCAQKAFPEKYKSIVKAYEQNSNAPILDQKAIDLFFNNYKPVETDPKFSVLLWKGQGHKNLPPHLIQAAGLDPLRDDALIFDKELKEAGVEVQTTVYQGVPHGFDGLFAGIGAAVRMREEKAAWAAKNFKQ